VTLAYARLQKMKIGPSLPNPSKSAFTKGDFLNPPLLKGGNGGFLDRAELMMHSACTETYTPTQFSKEVTKSTKERTEDRELKSRIAILDPPSSIFDESYFFVSFVRFVASAFAPFLARSGGRHVFENAALLGLR